MRREKWEVLAHYNHNLCVECRIYRDKLEAMAHFNYKLCLECRTFFIVFKLDVRDCMIKNPLSLKNKLISGSKTSCTHNL